MLKDPYLREVVEQLGNRREITSSMVAKAERRGHDTLKAYLNGIQNHLSAGEERYRALLAKYQSQYGYPYHHQANCGVCPCCGKSQDAGGSILNGLFGSSGI